MSIENKQDRQQKKSDQKGSSRDRNSHKNKQINQNRAECKATDFIMLQKVISANEQLIKSQSTIIKQLVAEIINKQKQIEELTQKNNLLQKFTKDNKSQNQCFQSFSHMTKLILQLQNDLVQTKILLAVKSSQTLVSNFSFIKQEKDGCIRDLMNKNRQLDEQLQRTSVISQPDFQQKKAIKNIQNININKDNLPQFIKSEASDMKVFSSVRSIFDRERSTQDSQKQIESLRRVWQKQMEQHILPRSKLFSISSLVGRQMHLDKFLKMTSILLRKHHGIPHIHRNKVWSFISEDRLGISNSLYIQLLDRRNRGWVSDKIRKQIQRDIHRSFNGQGSKQKLLRLHEVTLNRTKSSELGEEVSQGPMPTQVKGDTDLQSTASETLPKIRKSSVTLKQSTQDIDPKQRTHQNNFRIAQDVTEVLQLFYIYRPDIGFVQGMTYPAIVLTLVTGKISAFRILCNLLLCNDFFKKMITFEPSFINYFCRIFDQLLLFHNPALYKLVFKQHQIRSQVFLVDWFFTFFSRGISPNTILRIWDLLLYQTTTSPKYAQIIFYRLSLIIFTLLEPILLQTNYEQCIRTIREYSKKLDEQQLIDSLYESLKDSNSFKAFEEKYIKIKLRVEKKYYSADEE